MTSRNAAVRARRIRWEHPPTEGPLETKRNCTRAAKRGTKVRPTKPKGRGFGNG